MKNLNAGLKAGLAALAVMAAATQPARAEEFTLLIYETSRTLESRNDPARAEAYWNGYNAFAGALAQAGVLRGGTALSETQARTVVIRGGETDVRDRARSVGGSRLGGYFLIDVATIEDATSWAERAPIGPGGAIEVRPHRVNPSMSAQMAPAMAN